MRLPIPNVTAMAIPPSRNWRTPERSTGRPVSRPGTHTPPASSATAVMIRVAARLGRPARYGSSGTSAPSENAPREGEARQQRGRQFGRIDAEFFPGVHSQGRPRVLGHRGRHPVRGLRVRAVLAEVARQLLLLGHGEHGEHLLLQGHLGVHQLVLVGDRDVLSGAHQERPRHQRGHAGQHDRVRGRLAPAQPGDQGSVGNQTVHRPEDGRRTSRRIRRGARATIPHAAPPSRSPTTACVSPRQSRALITPRGAPLRCLSRYCRGLVPAGRGARQANILLLQKLFDPAGDLLAGPSPRRKRLSDGQRPRRPGPGWPGACSTPADQLPAPVRAPSATAERHWRRRGRAHPPVLGPGGADRRGRRAVW